MGKSNSRLQSPGAVSVADHHSILDIISLITLEVTESINLEEPEPAPKLKLRLSPFWQWRGVQVIQHANVSHFSDLIEYD